MSVRDCGYATQLCYTILLSLAFPQRLFDRIQTPSGFFLSDHFGVRVLLYLGRGDRRVCRGSNVLGRDVDFLDLVDVESQMSQFCFN